MRQRTLTAVASTMLAILSACSNEQQGSEANDIFREDAGDPSRGNARRHPADDQEKLWTISMGGCTGHLIAPEYMMTAAHCSPRPGAKYTSGSAQKRGTTGDITVSQVVENDAGLDYAILKISWTAGKMPEDQKFPPLVATKASDVATGRGADAGDEIFTVGFPGDTSQRWGATYSEGRAKEVSGSLLRYNIGIINGNSGGGVWKKSDKMLVSLTNGGPHALGQAGWDTAGADSAQNWNHGAAMWNVYARSATLKDIFPGGKNRFAQNGGGGTPAGKAWVAIGAGDNGTFTLAASAPKGATRVVLCKTAKAADCRQGADGFTETRLDRETGDMKIFKALATTSLQSEMVLSIAAFDQAGALVAGQTVKFKAN